MSRGRRLAYWLAAPLIDLLLRFLWSSSRLRALSVHPAARELLDSDEPALPCMWHAHQALGLPYFVFGEARGRRYCALVSPSVDGELASRVIRRWGVHVVRGSSTRTGGRAIRQLYRAVTREGYSLLVTPDGPQGPAREAKAGVIALGQLTGRALLPMSYAAAWSWRAPGWDRPLIPLPFSPVAIAVGAPLRLPADLPPEQLAPCARELGAILDRLTGEAATVLASDGGASDEGAP